MIKYIYKYLSLLLTIISSITSAQTYPVQVVPVINSPYSNTLSDYSNPMADRLRVQLLTKDLLVNNRAARLHVKIQGNGITAQSIPMPVGVAPIYLNGGEILTLTSADLAPYFRYENLQGINTWQYSEPLPDGVYTLCFQAYDATTRKWISDNSCTTIYLKQNDPPILYQPTNFEQISSADFPNIPFSWTPRHINATNVTYNFELREVIDPSIDPRFGFEISKPLYKEEGLSTTMLVYDLSKPALISGKQYAWRVRAISTSGLSENNVFKNRGYSEIFTFTYADNCKAPAFLLSEQQAPNRVKLIWQGDNSQQKYHIQYRKANIENAEWFDTKTVNTQTFLSGLEPGTTYEFRVGALCGTISQYGTLESYSYSGLQTFTLKKDEKNIAYNCGITPSIDIANKQPLNKLIEQEEFLAGDFTVKVQEVTGSNGVFSGTGYIKVPYLFDTKIGVVFNNVSINSDHKLIDGVVETTYDPDWKNVNFVDDIITVNQQDINVNFPITNPSDISIVNGEMVVKGPNGQTETFPGGKDSVITDNAGHSYYVDENGKVTGPFQQAAGGKPTPQNTDGVDKNSNVTAITAKGVKVSFEKYTNSKYAYDKVDYKKALTDEYKEVDGEFVPFKAVANGDEEPFVAKVSISDPAIKADSIIFKTQNGVRIDAEKIGNSNDFLLKLKGAQKFAVEQVMATIKQGDKYKVAGVFNLVHIMPRTVNLRLVPTEGVSISESTKEEIKKIYKQIGISLDISVDEKTFDISSYLDGGKLPTQDEMGDLSTYSPQQNAIIAAYKKERPVQQAYYLFITKAEPSTSQIGYMRLNNQFGFIFDNSARTIAHELGHGAFRLEHPFKKFKSKGLNSGNTNALMDYPAGTDFLFTDWKQINDPAFKIYTFQSQSSGELAGGFGLTPDFKFIKANTSTALHSVVKVGEGFLPGFVENNVQYQWVNATEENKKGYYPNGDTTKEVYVSKEVPTANSIVWLIYEHDAVCGKSKFIKTTYADVEANIINKKEDKASALAVYIKKYKDITDNTQIIYSGYIPCNNSTSSGNGANGDIINHTNRYKDEIQKMLNSLNLTKSDTGIKGKIYITESKDTQYVKEAKEALEALDKSDKNEIYIWVNYTGEKDFELNIAVGNGVKNKAQLSEIQKVLKDHRLDIMGMKLAGDFNPLTAMLDGIAQLANMAKVPERLYNPDAKDYNQIPGEIYGYISRAKLKDTMLDNLQATGKYSYTQVEFAYACGLWNGAISVVGGIPEGASFLVKMVTNEEDTRSKTFNAISQLSVDKVTKMAEDEWIKFKDKNACIQSEKAGELTVQVVTVVATFTKMGAVTKVVNALDELDAFGQVAKLTGKLIKPVMKVGNKSVKFVLEEGGQIIKRGDNFYALPKNSKIDLQKLDEVLGKTKNLPLDENRNKLNFIDGEPYLIGTEDDLKKALNDKLVNTLDFEGLLKKYPSLWDKINNLDNGLKKQFYEEFSNAGEDIIKQMDNEELFNGWKNFRKNSDKTICY